MACETDGRVAMRDCRPYNAPRLLLHAGADGEVPERSIGTVSKTVVLLVGTEGSNPSLSANIIWRLT